MIQWEKIAFRSVWFKKNNITKHEWRGKQCREKGLKCHILGLKSRILTYPYYFSVINKHRVFSYLSYVCIFFAIMRLSTDKKYAY